MVNYGVSKACQECKQRKKKCDETRPFCLRCTKNKRQCPGYKPETDLLFRNSCGQRSSSSTRPFSNENNAHATISKSIPPSDPINLSWPEIESLAVKTFISDYCISSSDRTLSRGYLNGLESLIEKAGPHSNIAESCKIISLANLGKKTASPVLLQKAETLYFELLPSFRGTIAKEGKYATIHSLLTAVLLGLYEIITSTRTEFGSHVAHARGVSAILINKFSPFELVSGGQHFQLPNLLTLQNFDIEEPEDEMTPLHQTTEKFGILRTAILGSPWATLDPIFVRTIELRRKSEILLSDGTELTAIDDVRHLMQEAEVLRMAYQTGVTSFLNEWRPNLIGILPSRNHNAIPEVGHWPGPVLGYYDLYVACINNSYQKSHLMVLNIIARCHREITRDAESDPLLWEEAQKLALEIVASIPYYLAKDVQAFYDQTLASGMTSKAILPGPSVGGLLSIHTLYTVSRMSVVNLVLKEYLRNCLAWIGQNMGIGQATVLSEHPSADLSDYVRQAHVLIWAGMLI